MALEKKKIAIAGIGTVGKGLVKILEQFGAEIPNLKVSVIASRKKVNLPKKKIFKDTVILNDAKNSIGKNSKNSETKNINILQNKL